MNFPNQNESQSDKYCRTCKLFPETQAHLLQCPQIISKLKILSSTSTIDENMIYSNVENQLKIVKIYTEVLDIRKSIIESQDDQQC